MVVRTLGSAAGQVSTIGNVNFLLSRQLSRDETLSNLPTELEVGEQLDHVEHVNILL